jgi:hypothetical protein
MNVGQILSKTLTKVHSTQQKFSPSITFGFDKISFCFISLMNEIFCFNLNSPLPNMNQLNAKLDSRVNDPLRPKKSFIILAPGLELRPPADESASGETEYTEHIFLGTFFRKLDSSGTKLFKMFFTLFRIRYFLFHLF